MLYRICCYVLCDEEVTGGMRLVVVMGTRDRAGKLSEVPVGVELVLQRRTTVHCKNLINGSSNGAVLGETTRKQHTFWFVTCYRIFADGRLRWESNPRPRELGLF